jgi:hypothetical protein
MKFEDIVLEEMYNEDDEELVNLNEDIFPITPFLAYASFKKNTFGALKDKMYDIKATVGKWANRKKAKTLITREKLRASAGKKSGKGDDATVYKLNSTQMNVMADIYNRHGNKIVKDIMEFRKNVLAPYSLIKRKVKEATRVTNKDKFGMTKAEFKAYLESGRRKIENRGERFSEKSEELRDRLDRIAEQIDLLKEAENKLGKEKGEFPRSILNRLYKDYKVHDKDLLGYSPDELRQVQSKMDAKSKEVADLTKRFSDGDADADDIEKAIELATRKPIKISTKKDGEDREKEINPEGNFNVALGRYMFRNEILNSLREPESNELKDTYRRIIQDMITSLNEHRRDTIRKLSSLNASTKLNDKEKLIWKKRSTASEASSDLNDFYQAIKEEDFLETPIYLERTPELKEAEQQIENEIKRFERSLEKKIGKEDFSRLKKHRLINNLITVRELKSTKDLFKDTEELLKTTNSDRSDLKKSEEYISPQDFERRIWSIHKYDFSSMSELNNAKKEVDNLVEKMKAQGDEQIVNKLSNVIERIKIRRTLEPQRSSYIGQTSDLTVGIEQIEKKAEEMANKKYDSSAEARRDKERLDDMIKTFKENEGTEAEKELSRIKFLLDKVERRMTW